MSQTPHTHLCVHSQFTLLGATPTVDALVEQAVADNFTHLALTDTNALYGAVAFDRACRAANIQPIIGMTATVQPLPDTRAMREDAPGELVLLTTGPTGYRSLCRLSSLIQGSPEREQIAAHGVGWDALAAHHEGLICLSGGRRGWVERVLRNDDPDTAMRYVRRLGGIYGEQAYLALELHTEADKAIADAITDIGVRVGLPTVAVQPIYCMTKAEQPRLRLLAAIQQNCPLNDVSTNQLPDGGDSKIDLHWRTPNEIQTRFADFSDALANLGAITAQCEPALPDSSPIWPVPQLPADQSPTDVLRQKATAGLQKFYSPEAIADARQRLRHELAIITEKAYAPLFLMVADIVRYARKHDIPMSTRGSVANSLVAYCMGITTIDPLEHDLLFERFLNPERSDPPDIDLDFCSIRRDEVLNYVRDTYGADRVALVATINTLRARSALRAVGKAHGLDEPTIKQLTRLLPDRWHPDPRRRVHSAVDVMLEQVSDARQRIVVEEAFAIIGQPDHLSIHPGGVVVTPGPTTDYAPVQWTPKGFLATQFDHGDVEALGLSKVDLLGIRALTVLATAVDLVQRHYAPDFALSDIPQDDVATGDMLMQGEAIGVFQCESSGARRTLRQLNVRNVQDLAVANAFFKPGPATGGMAAAFIRRYRGVEEPAYLHPALRPILESTKGVLLFQEQVLRIAREVAGLDWSEADHLRRGMSKFRAHEMATMRERFTAGCQRAKPDGPAFSPQQANTLWEQIIAFAGYGFNQGHATAYADVSYQSAYLRAHWPAAFLAARLANWGGFHHQAIYMAEAVRLGIAVRPPHINHSQRQFTLSIDADATEQEQPILWMGLGQVRSLRKASARAIIAECKQAPFADLADLLRRVPLQKKEIAHLIQCGALDGLGDSRAAMLAEATDLQRAGNVQQMTFAFVEQATVPAENPQARLDWETHILGQPVSVHPLELIDHGQTSLTPLAQVPTLAGRQVTVAAARLPGWTGGRGYFVGDGQTFVRAIGDEKARKPKLWQALLLRGRWRGDEWGGGWFQVEVLEEH